jgi:hypothetical protein
MGKLYRLPMWADQCVFHFSIAEFAELLDQADPQIHSLQI